jgi:hypothetical protein
MTRKATRLVAAAFGFVAGFGGPEHGAFEILRGSARPEGLVFAAMGPPCNPEQVWHACEPAMSILPNYLVTGILATILGLVTITWSVAFLHKKRGGLVLMLLSIALLLFGGGLLPPAIGVIGGLLATRINRPVDRQSTPFSRGLARLWPWPVPAFLVWLFGQFIIGHFFNDFLLSSGFLIPLAILGLMLLSAITAAAYDTSHAQAVGSPVT